MDPITDGAVAILRREGRAGFAEIGRRLGTSRTTIAKRINPLLSTGELTILAAIHPHLLGLTVIGHLSVRVIGDPSPVVPLIWALDAPVYLTEVAGPYQLIVEMQCRTIAELQNDIAAVRAIDSVVEVHVLIYDRMVRSFFQVETPALRPEDIDDLDLKIMREVVRDGRAGYAEIGAEVGLSLSACRTRLSRLLESGALQVGAVRGSAGTDDVLVFGIGIAVQGDLRPILELLQESDAVEFLARTVGRFDIITTVAVSSMRVFVALMQVIRCQPGVVIAEPWLHMGARLERYHASDRSS